VGSAHRMGLEDHPGLPGASKYPVGRSVGGEVRCREPGVGGNGVARLDSGKDLGRMRKFITEEEIESKRTPKGGFTKKQLAEWNVPWIGKSPPKGWKKRLLRDGYIEDRHEELDRECDQARDRDQTNEKGGDK
jgi:hypothetical protein